MIVKESTPRFVLIKNVKRSDVGDALSVAESECMRHGRHAVYKADSIPDGMASFECVQ